jgi:hypothetical protein
MSGTCTLIVVLAVVWFPVIGVVVNTMSPIGRGIPLLNVGGVHLLEGARLRPLEDLHRRLSGIMKETITSHHHAR